MALNAGNVRVGVSGVLSVGTNGFVPPTAATGDPVGADDLGLISEDGVTLTHPGAGDSTAIRAWQNGMVVRTIRTPSDENPTYQVTLIETKPEVIEATYNTTVDVDGSFVIDAGQMSTRKPWVLDVLDGDDRERHYIPQGEVTEIGDRVYSNGEAVGYTITIEAHRDDTINGNVKVWTADTSSASSSSSSSSA